MGLFARYYLQQICRPVAPHTTALVLLTCSLAMSSLGAYADELIPDDIAYKPSHQNEKSPEAIRPIPDATSPSTPVITPLAQSDDTSRSESINEPIPIAEIAAPLPTINPTIESTLPEDKSIRTFHTQASPPQKGSRTKRCESHNHLQKSLAITAFTRAHPSTSNAGNLYAVEQGFPQLLQDLLMKQHAHLSPNVLSQSFATTPMTEAQRKRHAQMIAKTQQTQFVLSGTIIDMSMASPDATYNPGFFGTAANIFNDMSRERAFDKRKRSFEVAVELRDGFTGEILLQSDYSTRGLWNTRKTVGFNSPAFWETPYGKRVHRLASDMSKEIAQVMDCQPFMASIDARPGQVHILLHGGANNGLRAGDSLRLYQLVVQGSNTEYQVSDTRLIKREANLYLSEVYPSHSIAMIEGGSYLNGQFLAVSE